MAGISERFLLRVINAESSFHPYAVSIQTNGRLDKVLKRLKIRYDRKKGRRGRYLYSLYPTRSQIIYIPYLLRYAREYSLGLMQISSTNGNFLKRLGIRTPFVLLSNPCLNIKVGTLLLLECKRMFRDWERALVCYNAGVRVARNKRLWKRHHRAYIRKILIASR